MPSILIVGGGPAGLSAAIYAARANIQPPYCMGRGRSWAGRKKSRTISALSSRFRVPTYWRAAAPVPIWADPYRSRGHRYRIRGSRLFCQIHRRCVPADAVI